MSTKNKHFPVKHRPAASRSLPVQDKVAEAPPAEAERAEENKDEARSSVMFICTANQVRSPMAQALFTRMVKNDGLEGQWRIESAGTWARDGIPSPAEVIAVMRSKGIDLQEHRSRMVTAGILHGFRLILTMEPGQKEALKVEFPEIAGRVYLLSEMVGAHYAVADPIGGIIEEYRLTADEIEELLARGKGRIFKLAAGG